MNFMELFLMMFGKNIRMEKYQIFICIVIISKKIGQITLNMK